VENVVLGLSVESLMMEALVAENEVQELSVESARIEALATTEVWQRRLTQKATYRLCWRRRNRRRRRRCRDCQCT